MDEFTELDAEQSPEDYAADFNAEAAPAQWPDNWQEDKPDTFTLHDMGKSCEFEREEAVELAQKGLHFDRLRREHDEMMPRLTQLEGLLGALSRHSGMDENQLLLQAQAANLQAEAERNGEKLSYEDALARAEPYDSAAAEELRRRESLLEFSRRFPEVKPENISADIWQSFYEGGELSALYALEENGRLQARVRELELREKNQLRSLGSRRSAGQSRSGGFEDMWFNGD